MATKKSKGKNETPKRLVCTQHMKPVSENGLGKSRQASTFPLDRFSKLKTGKYRNICKVCQTRLSKQWTTKRADYRKQYQQARMLVSRGFDVQIPNAKDYKSGDVLRTSAGKVFNLAKAEKAAAASA